MSYTKDIQLIANSLAVDNGYNSLTPERIADVENQENFLEGLALHVALVCELAKAADADPEEIIQNGRSQELIPIEDKIRKKASQNPEELTFEEATQIRGNIPPELRESLKQVMKSLDDSDEIEHDGRVADTFPEENHED